MSFVSEMTSHYWKKVHDSLFVFENLINTLESFKTGMQTITNTLHTHCFLHLRRQLWSVQDHKTLDAHLE